VGSYTIRQMIPTALQRRHVRTVLPLHGGLVLLGGLAPIYGRLELAVSVFIIYLFV
jgi:hypothetical protein